MFGPAICIATLESRAELPGLKTTIDSVKVCPCGVVAGEARSTVGVGAADPVTVRGCGEL